MFSFSRKTESPKNGNLASRWVSPRYPSSFQLCLPPPPPPSPHQDSHSPHSHDLGKEPLVLHSKRQRSSNLVHITQIQEFCQVCSKLTPSQSRCVSSLCHRSPPTKNSKAKLKLIHFRKKTREQTLLYIIFSKTRYLRYLGYAKNKSCKIVKSEQFCWYLLGIFPKQGGGVRYS